MSERRAYRQQYQTITPARLNATANNNDKCDTLYLRSRCASRRDRSRYRACANTRSRSQRERGNKIKETSGWKFNFTIRDIPRRDVFKRPRGRSSPSAADNNNETCRAAPSSGARRVSRCPNVRSINFRVIIQGTFCRTSAVCTAFRRGSAPLFRSRVGRRRRGRREGEASE